MEMISQWNTEHPDEKVRHTSGSLSEIILSLISGSRDLPMDTSAAARLGLPH